MVEWLQKHWFILAFLLSAGMAIGQQQNKIQSLEEAIKSNIITQNKVEVLQQQSARVDERTQAIQKDQQETKAMLNLLLSYQRQTQRSIINHTK
jgi:hypothetical protein